MHDILADYPAAHAQTGASPISDDTSPSFCPQRNWSSKQLKRVQLSGCDMHCTVHVGVLTTCGCHPTCSCFLACSCRLALQLVYRPPEHWPSYTRHHSTTSNKSFCIFYIIFLHCPFPQRFWPCITAKMALQPHHGLEL